MFVKIECLMFKQVGIFDPFSNTRQMNISDPNVDEWGAFRRFDIKYLDYSDNWLLQKAYSLNKYPLWVTLFERFPTMVSTIPKYFAETAAAQGMKKSGYGGIDGFLLGNYANDMDFTIKILYPEGNQTYGYRVNNTFIGTLGDVVYGRADIAFNGRFYLNYGTDEIRYVSPIIDDSVCVVIPAAERSPQWKAIFKCFDNYFWFILFFMTAFTSIIYTLIDYYQEKFEMAILRENMLYKDYKHFVVEKEVCVKNVFSLIWKVIFGMNAKMPIKTVERLLISSCLLANIIIVGSLGVCQLILIFRIISNQRLRMVFNIIF